VAWDLQRRLLPFLDAQIKDPEGLVPRPVMHAAWPVRKSAHPLTFNKNTTSLAVLRELQVCYPSGPSFLIATVVSSCQVSGAVNLYHVTRLWKEFTKSEERNGNLKTALFVASVLLWYKTLGGKNDEPVPICRDQRGIKTASTLTTLRYSTLSCAASWFGADLWISLSARNDFRPQDSPIVTRR
jgi:hypothetical protein